MTLLVKSWQVQNLVAQDWLQTEGGEGCGQVRINVEVLNGLEVVVGQFYSREEHKA